MSDTEMVLSFHVFVFAVLWIVSLVESWSARQLIKSLYRLINAQNRRNDSQAKLIRKQAELIEALKHRNEIEMRRSLRAEAIARRN